MNNKIKRIEEMEKLLNASNTAIKSLEKALKEYSKAQDGIHTLATYYSSKE